MIVDAEVQNHISSGLPGKPSNDAVITLSDFCVRLE